MKDLQIAPREPWCIAHRGDSVHFPENTTYAFDSALHQPIDGIETDVQLTRDGVPVIFHDRTLHLVGKGRRTIRHAKLDELRTMDFGGWFGPNFRNQPILTLDELLTQHGTKTRWLLEIKKRGRRPQRLRQLMDRVIEAVHFHGIAAHAWILCFDLSLLQYGYQRDPTLQFVLNQRKPKWQRNAQFLTAYSINIGALKADFCDFAKKKAMPVWVYTCNNLRDVQHAINCGVQAIMSDDPAWLAQVLEQHHQALEKSPYLG